MCHLLSHLIFVVDFVKLIKIICILHIDKPGPPEGPLNIDEVDKDHVKLSWKPPKDDGGSPLTLVMVMKCCKSHLQVISYITAYLFYCFILLVAMLLKNEIKLEEVTGCQLWHL